MTSKQVMLTAMVSVLCGCSLFEGLGLAPDSGIESPYRTRRVWAVAVLRNESGSLVADGARLADHLAQQLEPVPNLDVMPVNRTIAAMDSVGLEWVRTPDEARRVMRTLGVDGLVVGTITAFDPYDPPKLGLAVELYTLESADALSDPDPRLMSRAATAIEGPPDNDAVQPVTVISGFYDASDGNVRRTMMQFARWRGPVKDTDAWHRYRISMDLYSQFIAYVTSERLMAAEAARFRPSREVKEPAS